MSQEIFLEMDDGMAESDKCKEPIAPDPIREVSAAFWGLSHTGKSWFVGIIMLIVSVLVAWGIVNYKTGALENMVGKHEAQLAAIEQTGITADGEGNRFKTVESRIELDVHKALKPVLEDFKDPITRDVSRMAAEIESLKREFATKAELQKEIFNIDKALRTEIVEFTREVDGKLHEFDKQLLLLRKSANQQAMISSLDAHSSFVCLVSEDRVVNGLPEILVAFCDLKNHKLTMFRKQKALPEFVKSIDTFAARERSAIPLADIATGNPGISSMRASVGTLVNDDFLGLLAVSRLQSSYVFDNAPAELEKYLLANAEGSESLQLPTRVDTAGKVIQDGNVVNRWKNWMVKNPK